MYLCDLFSIHTSLGAVGSQDIDMHCKQYRRLVVDRYVFIFAAFGRDGESLDFSWVLFYFYIQNMICNNFLFFHYKLIHNVFYNYYIALFVPLDYYCLYMYSV